MDNLDALQQDEVTKAPISIDISFMSEVKHGRVANLQRLLDLGGVDINMRHTSGDTYLHMACRARHEHVVSLLVENGAHLSLENKTESTPLHVALCQGTSKKMENIIRTLLVHGCNVHHMNANGKIALHMAVSHGSTAVVKLLLEYGADISDVDFMGHNALHFAAIRSTGTANTKLSIMRILLKHGTDHCFKLHCLEAELEIDSDFDEDSDENDTFPFEPVDLAEIHGNYEMAKMLNQEKTILRAECAQIHKAVKARAQETRRANELALVMGQHERLGASSLIKGIPVDVLQLILKHA